MLSDSTAAAPGNALAVIGLAGRFPGADDPAGLGDLLDRGDRAAGPISDPTGRWPDQPNRPDLADLAGRQAALLDRIDYFDHRFFNLTPARAARMDPRLRLLLEIAWEALESAGLSGRTGQSGTTGVFIGAGDNQNLQAFPDLARDQLNGLDNSAAGLANQVSHFLDLTGPSLTVDTTCSSSLAALDQAAQAIMTGRCDQALVGGVNLILTPNYFRTMDRMRLLSPDGLHWVMDRRANGFVPGEGAAAVVIKPLDRALTEGNRIEAVIRGSAINHTGRSAALTEPGLAAQTRVIAAALDRAGVAPTDLDYIELNAGGTVLSDAVEAAALNQALGQGKSRSNRDRPLLLGSVKANLGNLEAASGLAGLIKIILALRRDRLPACLNFERPNRFVNLTKANLEINTAPTAWPRSGKPRLAGINSFGVGGTNVHLIVEGPELYQSPPHRPTPDRTETAGQVPGRPELFLLSAQSRAALIDRADRLARFLTSRSAEATDPAAIASALAQSRKHFPVRLAAVADNFNELIANLHKFIANHDSQAPNLFSGQAPPPDRPAGPINPLRRLTDLLSGATDRPGQGEPTVEPIPVLPADGQARRAALADLAERYASGANLDLTALQPDPGPLPELPTYPFQREKLLFRPGPEPEASLGTESDRTDDDILSLLTDYLSRLSGLSVDEIDPNAPLEDLGLDSIFILNAIQHLREKTGLALDQAELFDARTLADVAALAGAKTPIAGSLEANRPTPTRSTPARPDRGEPIAVIGLAGRFPGAEDADRLWANLLADRSAIKPIPADRFDVDDYYNQTIKPGKTVAKWAALLDDPYAFDAARFKINPRTAQRIDPQQRILWEQLDCLFAGAGYAPDDLTGTRTGLFIGLSDGEYGRRVLAPDKAWTHRDGLGAAQSMAANRLSHFLGLTGPSLTVDTACSSALTALHLACRSLRAGECDLAAVGAASLCLGPEAFVVLSNAQVLSPTGRCRVFDRRADGYVRGEGAAAVLLKPLSRAERDNDNILALVLGSAINHNGATLSPTSPSLKAQIDLFNLGLGSAGVAPDSIDYVEAGSVAAPWGDPIELRAAASVFPGPIALGSLKPFIGHLEAASGLAGLVRTIIALNKQTLPALPADLEPINAPIESPEKILLPTAPRPWPKAASRPGRAIVTSLGFGGANAQAVVQAPDRPPAPLRPAPSYNRRHLEIRRPGRGEKS